MTKNDQIKMTVEALVKSSGQIAFTMAEVARLLGVCDDRIARFLADNGVGVKLQGNRKLVAAYDVVALTFNDQISPIDKRYRYWEEDDDEGADAAPRLRKPLALGDGAGPA